MSSRLILRIIAPTMAVSLLLLGLGGTTAWYLRHRQQESSQRIHQSVLKAETAGEMMLASQELRAHLEQFRTTGDNRVLDNIRQLRGKTDDWMRRTEGMAVTSRETELLDEIRGGYDEYIALARRLAASTDEERTQTLDRMRDLATDEILQPVLEYRDLNFATMAEVSRQNEKIADRMGLGVLLLGTSGAVAGLLMGFGVARGIQRSLVQLRVPIHDAAGKLNQVVGPMMVASGENIPELNVTLQKVSQRVGDVVERLQASQRAALRAEKMVAVGRLAASLAHELRNPLTSMRVLIQSAIEQGDSATLGGRDLVVLEEEIMRLDRSIQAFLDFARPPRLEKRPIDLGEVLQQTICLVARRAANQGLNIVCDLPQKPVTVEADAGQMRQVVLNLLLNAMEAAPSDGRIRVRLRTERATAGQPQDAQDGGDRAVIEVEDSGAGLSPEVRDRLFEPFTSTKETGTGLGLPICKRIVEEHGGTIDADNRPEGGAVFRVHLPMDATTQEPKSLDP